MLLRRTAMVSCDGTPPSNAIKWGCHEKGAEVVWLIGLLHRLILHARSAATCTNLELPGTSTIYEPWLKDQFCFLFFH